MSSCSSRGKILFGERGGQVPGLRHDVRVPACPFGRVFALVAQGMAVGVMEFDDGVGGRPVRFEVLVGFQILVRHLVEECLSRLRRRPHAERSLRGLRLLQHDLRVRNHLARYSREVGQLLVWEDHHRP